MKSHQRVKYACYTTNLSMSVISNLSPLLFLTFRSLYGISYTLLGLLVLVNFVTQLTVDLIFSFFSHKFNIPKTVRLTPVLAVVGLVLFAIAPWLLPTAPYVGLLLGTVIFSASGGLAEVLISPVIAAIPAENPEREMSKLHSVYAWGVVGMILVATLFLLCFGGENWQWLALLLAVVPLVSSVLFAGAAIPQMETPTRASGVVKFLKMPTLWLCFFAIFLGGAAECTMAQWSSGYLERAVGIPKMWGDIGGVAMFALMLGLGRSLYAKYGRHIETVLLAGAIGATACYLVAAVSSVAVLGLIACGVTGFCVSMLWPGCLVVASERVPSGGVFLYAMMAAGGDLGASIAPQLVGSITDAAMANARIISLAQELGLSAEQCGMKLGMLVAMLFPLIAIGVYLYLVKTAKKYRKG